MTTLKVRPSMVSSRGVLRWFLLVAVVASSFLTLTGGCVHAWRPIGVPEIPLAAVRDDFDRTIPVRVTSRQGVERHTLFHHGIHRYDIEPDEWSQDFSSSLSTELRRRHVFPGSGAIEVTVAVDLEPIVERTVPAVAVRLTFAGFDKTYPSSSTRQAPTLSGELRRAMHEVLEDAEFRDGLRAAYEFQSQAR